VQPTKVLESQALSPVALASGAAAFDLQNDGNVHLRVDTVRLEGFAPDGARLFERETPAGTSWRRTQALHGRRPARCVPSGAQLVAR